MIAIGTKSDQCGWVDIEEIESATDISFLHIVGLLVTETGASNVCNVLRDLKMLNGYKVRVTIEVLDVPDNRKDVEKLPRPSRIKEDDAKRSARGVRGAEPPIPRGMSNGD